MDRDRDEVDGDWVWVKCPPGESRYVKRITKVCETCDGKGWEGPSIKYAAMSRDTVRCRPCGGSGVVEATTTYGLAEVDEFRAGTYFKLVALPEETPQ